MHAIWAIWMGAQSHRHCWLISNLGCSAWTLDEFEGEDVLPSCQEYFDLLCAMVEECELRFD